MPLWVLVQRGIEVIDTQAAAKLIYILAAARQEIPSGTGAEALCIGLENFWRIKFRC